MAQTGVVKKSFPYAMDGVNVEVVKEGRVLSFPDRIFDGLRDGGYVEASKAEPENGTAEDDVALDEATERRLSGMSDADLLATIARRGTPFGGRLVHAVLVAEAREQLRREAAGAKPVSLVDPNAGIALQQANAPAESVVKAATEAVEAREAAAEAVRDQFGEERPERKPKARGK